MRTLLLDRTLWDLTKDSAGNIAVASEPYSVAQDVSSAARLFLGEAWYNTTRGVPYFQSVLGQFPPLALMKALWRRAALTVPLAKTAAVFVERVAAREVTGQIQTKLQTGGVVVVSATWPPTTG